MCYDEARKNDTCIYFDGVVAENTGFKFHCLFNKIPSQIYRIHDSNGNNYLKLHDSSLNY